MTSTTSALSLSDWGRTGGNLSTVRRENGGYDSGPDYWCSDPSHGFADDDVTGKDGHL